MTMQYAQVCLTLASDCHIGSGRAGMLAKSHRFIPAHVVSYALAAAIGKSQGGQYADFERALEWLQKNTHCGPLFLQNPALDNQVLLPKRDQQAIEQQFLVASNHVTLHSQTRSSVEGALFEVEVISASVVRGDHQGQATQLLGGIWHTGESINGKTVLDYLGDCLLGGELKTGLGRIAHIVINESAADYVGIGRVDAQGLHLKQDDILLGVALDGVKEAAFYPWVGRLFDQEKGFGRRISQAAFVAYDAAVQQSACFLPQAKSDGFGCWQVCG